MIHAAFGIEYDFSHPEKSEKLEEIASWMVKELRKKGTTLLKKDCEDTISCICKKTYSRKIAKYFTKSNCLPCFVEEELELMPPTENSTATCYNMTSLKFFEQRNRSRKKSGQILYNSNLVKAIEDGTPGKVLDNAYNEVGEDHPLFQAAMRLIER